MLLGLAILLGIIIFGTLASIVISTDATKSVVGEAETALVISVTDGDTIRVDYSGGSDESVRLIGINTPETDECLGSEATRALEQLVDGLEVTLVGDVTDTDDYSRLLRYVYLADGSFVNEVMVRQGFALANEYPPNVAQSGTLVSAQDQAQSEELGLWAKSSCGEPTEARLVITQVEYDSPGNDKDNLNGEWVEIANQGSTITDLTGWVLKDESSSHRFSFPDGFALDVDSDVRVFSGCGTNTATSTYFELYWCENGPIWNNDGDTAFLLDSAGNIHDDWGY